MTYEKFNKKRFTNVGCYCIYFATIDPSVRKYFRNTIDTGSEVSPLWVYSYEETITVEYPTAVIPNEIPYEYYHNVYGWMRGIMKYQTHKIVKGKYVATFKGTMYSNPL